MTPQTRRRQKPWLDERLAPNGHPIKDNFALWFRDSVIVSKDGAPLPVFHGTDDDVHSFDRGIAYFSDDKAGAGRYGGHILTVYLSIRRPYIHDDTLFSPAPEFIEQLKAQGHDGIISAGEDPGERYFIAFHAEQVKSATSNSGVYDPARADIADSEPAPKPSPRGLSL